MKEETIRALASELLTAWKENGKVRPYTTEYPEMTLEDAYRIQQAVITGIREAGYHVSGRKMGYTNPVMQKKMELAGPSTGYLLREKRYPSGSHVPHKAFIQPGIETEICFVLKKDLTEGGYTADDIRDALAGFRISMEIVDMRQERKGKTQRDSVGDNGSFGAYVPGEKLCDAAGIDLAGLTVILRKNGEETASGTGINVMEDPINSLLWAANTLAASEEPLKAGEEFMSGSYTPLIAAEAGDVFEAEFAGLGCVTVTFDGE